jgi:hypothetical protein
MVPMAMYTPEMNWSTRKGRTTTELALFADFGTEPIAKPSRAAPTAPPQGIEVTGRL